MLNHFLTFVAGKSDCGWLNSYDWHCQSGGQKVVDVIVWSLIGSVPLFIVWAAVTGAKQAARLKDPNSSEARAAAKAAYLQSLNEKETQLKILETYESLVDETTDTSFLAGPDEQIILIMTGVSLVETRRMGSSFKGGSAGVSYRLTKRVSVRSGSFQGQSIPGAEVPTIVDIGQFVVTTERAVFTGPKQSREFEFSKLLSVSRQVIGKGHSVLYLPVSNRKTVSGVGTGEGSLDTISARLNIAIGLKRGSKEAMIQGLRTEIENLKKNPPRELTSSQNEPVASTTESKTLN